MKAKRCIAVDQCIFIRKAFLGQAETPPYQVLVWTKEAELWKEGVARGYWPRGEMPQLRRDEERSTMCYEDASHGEGG